MSYQPRPLFSWATSLTILKISLKSEHFCISMFFTFLSFIMLHPVVFFCIIKAGKVWGNTNFKAYYLHLDLMKMVRVLDRSHRTIKDYWRSSNILKVSNINTAWEEVSVKYVNVVWWKVSHNLSTNSQDLSQWRTLLMTLAGQHKRPDWTRLEPQI